MRGSRLGLALASLALLAGLAYAIYRQAESPLAHPISLTPTLTGQPELCLTCHQGIEEISASHPVEAIGCVRCHGGDRLSLDPVEAHAGLIGGANPADLSTVQAACGGADCHSGSPDEERDHIARVMTSVQATYAGAIAQVRYSFGAQPDPVARFGVFAVTDDVITTSTGLPALAAFDPAADASPKIAQFAANCLTCHLSAAPRDEAQYHRLTGCAACHALSNAQGTYTGSDPTIPRDEAGHAAEHRLTTAIPYTQCNTCHNRGNYSLAQMAFLQRTDHPTTRWQDYYQPVGQFTKCEWELDCVDCHTSHEVMGDGDLHSSKSEVQYVQCRTCHGTLTEAPPVATIDDPNDVALRRAFVNGKVTLQVGDAVVVTDRGEKLWNVQYVAGRYVLTSKVTGEQYVVPLVMGSGCTQNPSQQESRYCHECHSVDRQTGEEP
jgi:Cytochrome c554 and c-prime